MKVALVGGAGFVGGHIADALVASGHEPVIFDVNVAPGRKTHTMNVKGESVDQICERLGGDEMDALIHLAAVSNTNDAFKNPTRCWEVNVVAADKMLQVAEYMGIDKVIVAGSSLVSGAMQPEFLAGDDSLTEENPFDVDRVSHPYVASKIALEMVAQNHRALYGLPVCVFRYGIMYGPRMAPGVVAHAFITRALKGEDLLIHGDGSQWRQYLHVADLARAHVWALEQWSLAEDQTFNIVPSWRTTILDMAQEVVAAVDPEHLSIEHGPARQDDIAVEMLDHRKAWKRLGWRAEISLGEGIAETVDWYRANG